MASLEAFLGAYTSALRNGNAAVFAGAGLSVPAGFVSWRDLLREIASDVGLDVDKETDLVSVAQFHVNEHGGRGKLNQKLISEFTAGSKITQNHTILSNLPIDTFWTTNYDRLIEQALEQAGKVVDVKLTSVNLAITKPDTDAIVYKMHGDISLPDQAVLTKDDYERYNDRRQLFTTKLQGDLVGKTFLFIGFSFDDPNLEYILARIRVLLGENQRPHYCFFKRPAASDKDSKEDVAYASVRQDLRIRDLKRFAINAVLVDEYSDITDALHRLKKRYWREKLFISGSTAEYSPRTERSALAFVRELSRELGKSFEVISGFGVGVGSAVLNGVLDHLASQGERRLDGHLVLRPFPQVEDNLDALNVKWSSYRDSMLSLAGIALFLFGNKYVDGKIKSADGMYEEFDIAVKKGLPVVPVGATGYVARELWDRVMADFDNFNPGLGHLREEFAMIGRTNLDDATLVNTVVKLVNAIRIA